MHYNESNTLTISDAFPRNSYDPTKYFEFTIDGKNTTTNHDIYYDIQLIRGAVPTGKTESNRMADNLLRFRLVSVSNNVETEIFNNKKYSDLSTNHRIYVATIPRNTTSEITHRYRLYMWIDGDITLGENDDYTLTEWNNLFASIRVDVTGDFDYKEVSTEANCFTTNIAIDYTLNDLTNNSTALQACVNFITNTWSRRNQYTLNQTIATNFCQGTGTITAYDRLGYFQEIIDGGYDFSIEELSYLVSQGVISKEASGVRILDYDATCGSDVVIPSVYETTTYTYNSPLASDKVSTCVAYLTGLSMSLNNGESYESFCQGTGTIWGYTFQNMLDYPDYSSFSSADLAYFVEQNIISSNTGNHPVTHISNIAFDRKGLTSVIIPNSLLVIEDGYDYTGAFSHNELTSVVVPNNVRLLGDSAFAYNKITSFQIPTNYKIRPCLFGINKLQTIQIPNGVQYIGIEAFADNELLSLTIPSSVISIGEEAFSGNNLTTVDIPNNVTYIGPYAFNYNNLASVTIGSGINDIGWAAFNKYGCYASNSRCNENLNSITINKSCSDIRSMNYYPWLRYQINSNVYSASGVTVYGSNNEVCDSF